MIAFVRHDGLMGAFGPADFPAARRAPGMEFTDGLWRFRSAAPAPFPFRKDARGLERAFRFFQFRGRRIRHDARVPDRLIEPQTYFFRKTTENVPCHDSLLFLFFPK